MVSLFFISYFFQFLRFSGEPIIHRLVFTTELCSYNRLIKLTSCFEIFSQNLCLHITRMFHISGLCSLSNNLLGAGFFCTKMMVKCIIKVRFWIILLRCSTQKTFYTLLPHIKKTAKSEEKPHKNSYKNTVIFS